MERYLTILLSYLLIIPGAVLLYAPMQEQMRYSKKKIILFGTALLAVTAPLCGFLEYKVITFPNAVFLPYLILLFVIYHRTLTVHISKSLMIYMTVITWLSYANGFTILIDSRFKPDGIPSSDNLGAVVIQLCISIFLALLFIFPLRKYGSEIVDNFHDRKVWYMAAIISGLFILICTFLMPMKYETLYVNNVLRSYIVLLSTTLILHLLLCLILHFIIMGMIRSQKTEEQNKLYEMRESHYLKQQRYMDENARVRHDFKHTIRTLKQLSDKDDLTALKGYIEQYFDALPENDTIAFCNNNAVNAVLNYYHNLAEQSAVTMNWQIDIPENIPFKNVDLCNIIGNILDNAITACREIPESERWIQLTIINKFNTNLYIVATNHFSGKVKLNNDRYLSTHRDGNGIGLTSIEAIAESYGGTANYSHEDKTFFTNVVLPIAEQV